MLVVQLATAAFAGTLWIVTWNCGEQRVDVCRIFSGRWITRVIDLHCLQS